MTCLGRVSAPDSNSGTVRIQRKCACGGAAQSGGMCKGCVDDEVQRKLAVGSSSDPLEAEADRVAQQVLSSPSAAVSGQAPISVRRFAPSQNVEQSRAPTSVDLVLQSAGRPLDTSTSDDMGQRFGRDFSQVRIHVGPDAARSARDVNAHAFTAGEHIVFGEGRYSPATRDGRRLLAHELTHVLQQRQFGGSAVVRRDGPAADPLEGLGLVDPGAVKSIVVDPGSRRTRFYTVDGRSFSGTVKTLTASFAPGDYILKVSKSNDPARTWDIYNADGTPYPGGLQFDVLLNDVNFGSLNYTSSISLKVASGLLPKLIDIEARIKTLREQFAKTYLNGDEEREILRLFEDVPPEQAGEFIKRLREEKDGDLNFLDRLDKRIDGENNIALHQLLSKLKLQAGGAKSAKALADAPELAWHDVMGFFEQQAVFSVTPTGNGKYRIKYLGGIASGLYSKPEFDEIKRMDSKSRLNIMTGEGIEVDADQPIIVHDYDSDRHVILTAEDLIAYQHSGKRKFLQDVGTIASLATPAGAETVGARVLAYGVQIASVATLIVDENKLNIRKWFPNWGPAMIAASEKIKLVIAVIGVAQLVKGGWNLIANLRKIRAARAAMDAKAVVTSAEEAAQAEKQALQLESNADRLINQAELARKELGFVDDLGEAGQKLEGAAAKLPESAEAVAAKTRTIESAIGSNKFAGDFAGLANRELAAAAKNPARVRLSKMPGYSIEVPIEGTEHFLARNSKGGWCLFSGSPKGCGVLGIEKTVDDLFAEIGKEIGTSKASRLGSSGRIDLASAVADAEAIPVDLRVQPHSAAPDVRAAQGVSGKDIQSAHHAATAAVKNVPGYSRGGALTVLLPRAVHKAFDDFWKEWSIAQRKAGVTQVTVEKFVDVLDRAIKQTPGLDAKAKGTMSWIVQNEFYRDLGLKPLDLIDLPYPNIKPGSP